MNDFATARLLYRSLIALAGRSGAMLASTAVLMILAAIHHYPFSVVGKALLGLLAFRMATHLSAKHAPVLESATVRKSMGQVWREETLLSLAFPTMVFVLGWPISVTHTVVFVILNMATQIGWFGLMTLLRRRVNDLHGQLPKEHRSNRVAIVGTGPRAKAVTDMLLRSPELDVSVEGFLDFHRKGLWRYRDLPLLGHPNRLERIVAEGQLDAVILAAEPEDIPLTTPLFMVAEKMGVPLSVMPDLYRGRIARPVPASLNGTPTLTYRAVPESRLALIIKHSVDRLGAVAGLFITAPLMLLVALAIKLDSRGPILFRQVRAGRNGRPFRMLKFRTMRRDAERRRTELAGHNEMSGPVFKMKDDPRVTRVGRFLRRFSIDELPQFVNVLRGEMSLVGPRPPLPSEVSAFEPWQRRKLSVKPGLTCIWQVSGRNTIDFDDWMKLDLEYIDNWSLLMDARILARTVPAVFRARGAC